MTLTQSQEIIDFKFREFKSTHYPKLSDGLAFMQFATSLALQNFQLSEADIQCGVTEGSDDGGIDGFHIVVNKTEAISESTRNLASTAAPANVQKNVPFDVVVVQSKSSFDGWDNLALPKLHEVLERILTKESLQKLRTYPLNEKVLSQVDAFRKYQRKLISLDPARTFTVYLMQPVKESALTPAVKRSAAALRKMIESYLPSSTTVRVELLAADGMERLRATSNDFEGILRFHDRPLGATHAGTQAWLGLVSVEDFLKFIRRPKTQVVRDEFFATNVRDFAGSAGVVNSAIRRSLSKDSSAAFWWMNNGLTVIADRAADQSDNAFLLTNPQIVNGLQTSNVIHEAASAGAITKKRLKESLLVRVISEIDPAVRESIIQGTNNQTPVNSIQLFANDDFQKEIETFLEAKGWYYERRRWQYRNQGVARSRIKSILELGQAVIAVSLLRPETARGRPKDLLGKESDYRKVFDPTTPLNVYSALLDLMEVVEGYLQMPAAQSISHDPTNERYYVAAGAALRIVGVRKAGDMTSAALAQRLTAPSSDLLEDVHTRVASLASSAADKKERDKLFKGQSFRESFVNDFLAWNQANPM
jgi:hypothetical protein